MSNPAELEMYPAVTDGRGERERTNGRPPKWHAATPRHAKPGAPHAENARLPNWASLQFSVPSLNYPQGGVPCRMGIRTNATPRKGPSS